MEKDAGLKTQTLLSDRCQEATFFGLTSETTSAVVLMFVPA